MNIMKIHTRERLLKTAADILDAVDVIDSELLKTAGGATATREVMMDAGKKVESPFEKKLKLWLSGITAAGMLTNLGLTLADSKNKNKHNK